MKDIFYYFWRSGHSDQLDPKNILYINKSKTGGNPEHSKEFSDQFGNALGGFKLVSLLVCFTCLMILLIDKKEKHQGLFLLFCWVCSYE